jgi:hypothetical protein
MDRSEIEAAGVRSVMSSVNRDCRRGPSRGPVPFGVKGDDVYGVYNGVEGIGSPRRLNPESLLSRSDLVGVAAMV